MNLFLIGVNKAGTSWLHYLLSEHPKIFMAEAKELWFFGDVGRPHEPPHTIAEYHENFPFEDSYHYFGDGTVQYYKSGQAAKEIQSYNPDAKLLAIVRDPIQRLLSQFRYHKQLGLIDEEMAPMEAISERDSLLRDSHYEETLPRYRDRFGTDQFRVVSLEEGRNTPEAFWRDLQDFLDLPSIPLPSSSDRPENPTGSAGFRWVYRNTVRPIRRHFPGVYQRMLRSPTIRRIKLLLLHLLGTAEREPLSPEQRERLREEFAPTYSYLRDLGFDAYENP